MASPVVGKWTEASQVNISELYAAVGLPDPAPTSDKACFEWIQGADGTWTENFSVGSALITSRTFKSGEKSATGITTTIDGSVFLQTEELPSGGTLDAKRVFSGTEMTTTLTSQKTDLVSTIRFEKTA